MDASEKADKVKRLLSAEIKELIESKGWSQRKAAAILGLSQPAISYIVTGKIERHSIDLLIKTLVNAGYNIDMSRVDGEVGHVSLDIKKK